MKNLKNVVLDSRSLSKSEYYFYALSKLHGMNVTFFAEVTGKFNKRYLKEKLLKVQKNQPLLCYRIVLKSNKARFELLQSPPPIPLKVRSINRWRDDMMRELVKQFDTGNCPLAKSIWYNNDGDKSIICIIIHHAICDGLSGANLLGNILSGYPMECQTSYKTRKLPPSMESSFPKYVRGLTRLRFAMSYMQNSLRFSHILNSCMKIYVFHCKNSNNKFFNLKFIRLEKETQELLILACRKEGTTLQGAIGAAALLSMYDVILEKKLLSLKTPVNLRRKLNGVISNNILGLYIGALQSYHWVSGSKSFWQLAREYKQVLSLGIKRGDAYLAWDLLSNSGELTKSKRYKYKKKIERSPPSIIISNFGTISNFNLGHEENILSLSATSIPAYTDYLLLTITTYNDNLAINVVYSRQSNFHDKLDRFTENFSRKIRSIADSGA